MIDLANISVNIPKVALNNYFWLISGQPKAGKTTLFSKIINEYYNGDASKALLLAFEKGYQALKIRAVDIEDWSGFEDIVDQLVDRKAELGIEIIGLDTADIAWEMAQQETIREWNIQNPAKRTKDIGGVGGYGAGYARAKEKMRSMIDRLMKAGYGIIAITHSKDKSIEEKSGLTYDQLIVSLPSSAREIFVNLADFVIFLTTEKELDEDQRIFNKRYIYWRTDGYVEAGCRFPNVPQKIEYDVNEFLRVFKEAVESEFPTDETPIPAKLDTDKKEDNTYQNTKETGNNEPESQTDNTVSPTLEMAITEIKEYGNKLNKDGVAVADIVAIVGDPNKIKTLTEAKKIMKKLKTLG